GGGTGVGGGISGGGGAGIGGGFSGGGGTLTSVTAMGAENSEVPSGLAVAVAVRNPLAGDGDDKTGVKLAFPVASVCTWAVPRKTSPSRKPDGSEAVFRKNSRRKDEPGELSRVPWTSRPPAVLTAEVSTGKFWRLFGPLSASPESFAVTPTVPRS